MLRPLRDLIHIEKLPALGRTRDAEGNELTAGGLVVPRDYAAPGRRKAINRPDEFRARVLATGPEVRELQAGDEILVLTWGDNPDGSRRSLYTGIDVPDGTLLIRPSDVVCLVEGAAS